VTVIFSGNLFSRSIAFEKSNKLLEVIISAVSIEQLLSGKLLGLILLGIVQIFTWGIIGVIFSSFGLITNLNISFTAIQIIYFFMGYLFFSTLFVCLGALSKSDYDAHQLTANLSLILISPIILSFYIISNPYSAIAVLLSYVPFTSPLVILFRLSNTSLSTADIVSTITILIFSIYISIRLCSYLLKKSIYEQNSKSLLTFFMHKK
jgi:ABC-2 type transport system permease protein